VEILSDALAESRREVAPKDEALDLALEALENSYDCVAEEADRVERMHGNYPTRQGKVKGLRQDERKHMEAITAIKKALAAPVQSCYCPNCEAMGKELAKLKAQPAPVQKRTNYAVHLHHCNIGECEGVCKYGDDDCPALEHADMKAKWDRSTPPAAQRPWVGLTDEEFEDIELGCRSTSSGKIMAMQKVEAKLKEKNNG
jgi:hypothetical protein